MKRLMHVAAARDRFARIVESGDRYSLPALIKIQRRECNVYTYFRLTI